MSTLLENAQRLDHVVSSVEDVKGAGQTAEVLTKLDRDISSLAEQLAHASKLLRDEALPESGGFDSSRVETVVRGCDKVTKRVEENPLTVNSGTTWSNLQSAARGLVADLRKLGVQRWRELVGAQPIEEWEDLLVSLVPGAAGVEEFRASVERLAALADLEGPEPGAAREVQGLVTAIQDARKSVTRHMVPDEIREDYSALVQGTLPLPDFTGPIAEFVRSIGLEDRLSVRLDQGEDG